MAHRSAPLIVLLAAFLFAFLPPRTLQAEMVTGLEAGPIGFETLPDHARAIVLTFVGRARDGDSAALTQRLGVQNAELIIPEARFRYEGFGLREVVLNDLSQEADDPTKIHIAGELRWKDHIGRRALSFFEANYRLTETGTTLEQAAWEPQFSIAPQVRTVTFPVSKAGQIEAIARETFAGFFLATTELASAKTPTADSLVTVFLMDRTGPSTHCDLKLSAERDGTDGEDGIVRARHYEQGWSVLGTSLKASAFSAEGGLWLKVLCGEKEGDFLSRPKRDVVSVIPISTRP